MNSAASIWAAPGRPFTPVRRDAAAALALAVAGHLALLAHLGSPGRDAAAARLAAPPAAPRISWLQLRPLPQAGAPMRPVATAAPTAALAPAAPAAAAAAARASAPPGAPAAAALAEPRPAPAEPAEPATAAAQLGEVRGVPIGALPGALAALAAPHAGGWRSPPRTESPQLPDAHRQDNALPQPAPRPVDDGRAHAMREQIAAAAWRQLAMLDAPPAGATGRCVEIAGRELACDHPAAQQAVAPVAAALAQLLRQLAVAGAGPSTGAAALTYADGRFALELR